MTLAKSKTAKGALLLVVLMITAIAFARLYVPWRIQKAEGGIRKFCDEVVVGDAVGSIRSRAETAGLSVLDRERDGIGVTP